MPAENFSLKTYSPEELRMLAAEGRLKGRGVQTLFSVRSQSRQVGRAAFETLAGRLPCWADPSRLLRTFLDLVCIPSPPGREDAVADYVEDRLGALGFTDRSRDVHGNLLATRPALDARAPGLLFTAHMDCFYPGGVAPVRPVFTDAGEISTDGANSLGADDKAGIAAILAVLEFLVLGRLPHGEIRTLFTVQEELGFRGIKQVPARVLNDIHFVLSMDPPVRVERGETAHMAVLHLAREHPFVELAQAAARDCGLRPRLLFAEDGYVGGDTLCLAPLGAQIIDFCSCSRYPHTPLEHLRVADLFDQASWMAATVERALRFRPLQRRPVYREERIGELIGVRKQTLPEALIREKQDLARSLHTRPGPRMVSALAHLSTLAPRLGHRALLKDTVDAYARCMRIDHVPSVLREMTAALAHLAEALADPRPLEPLIPAIRDIVERGGDESAGVNGLHVLAELFRKERRVAAKTRVLRILILCLQNPSRSLAHVVSRFLRAHMDDTVHTLTTAFCNRDRSGWERLLSPGGGRIVGGAVRREDDAVRWTLLRQRILQLLLEEDRILPEMLEWIFDHDGAATQQIAIGFIDPDRNPRLTARILNNLKSRTPGVQETAVRFVGNHRLARATGALIDLLLTPYLCKNPDLVQWALDAIGAPALDEVIARLGHEAEYAPFVRHVFNRHDTTAEMDFRRLQTRLNTAYDAEFHLDDPAQLALLSHYLRRPRLQSLDDLTLWDRRRAVIFYEQLLRLYPDPRDLERLAEALEEADREARPHLAHLASQVNIFSDPDFRTLLSRENPRFLAHFVQLERQIPRAALLSRLREFAAGAQLDVADPLDVEIYYLYLLQQSPDMPDRTRYLRHIDESRRHLLPPVKPYCKAFTIVGDRVEEVGTVDRARIRALIAGLPTREGREPRLRGLLQTPALAKRERQRLITGLADAFEIDVSGCRSIEERAGAVLDGIDFEFDAAYRSVPRVIYPLLLRVRMKHRAEAVVAPAAEYALEYALINNPDIRDAFDDSEVKHLLDTLHDLFTDRVYEAEWELSEPVFADLKEKHVAALAQFYTAQWKTILGKLKKFAPEGRPAELIARTGEAMLEYDLRDPDQADLLDTNLNRLVLLLRPPDAGLVAFHGRHREFYRFYEAALRVRNIRQLKRIYREVSLRLQDEISYASRADTLARPGPPGGKTQPEGSSKDRVPAHPGYLKYARKELGKLDKLSSDFCLERALGDRVQAVQTEITRLGQVVVGASQILCAPVKDVSIIFRSWPADDCNYGNINQVLCPDCSFYKIISDGAWKGYFTLLELRRKTERAFLLDVINYRGLQMENENFIKVLLHQLIQMARGEDISYLLTSPNLPHLSNRDYIQRGLRKVFPVLGLIQGFELVGSPKAPFQSYGPNLAVIWQNPHASGG